MIARATQTIEFGIYTGQAPDDIQKALRPYGYYQVEVNAQLESVESGWVASWRGIE